VTLTKRAQIPFTRWLPAAMAAPTPVRALVHSSTLVTAGVWLLVRFRQMSIYLCCILLIVGATTLILARMGALMEVDGKKVVALSTLRQLGLMFMAISLGNRLICLFHLLIHAFAKANLFLIVGNFLHIRFSQQDSRQLSSGVERRTIFIAIFIRVFRLRGVTFSRGFFSKDSILISEFNLMRNTLSWLILIRIISLTLAYCIKLVSSLIKIESFNLSIHLNYSPISLFPNLLLVFFRVFLGYIIFNNIQHLIIFSKRNSGLYWLYLILRVVILILSYIVSPIFWGKWFALQVKLFKEMNSRLLRVLKKVSQLFSSTFLEGSYLMLGLRHSGSLYTQLTRIGYILTWISLILLLL